MLAHLKRNKYFLQNFGNASVEDCVHDLKAYLIFVTGTTGGTRGKKSVMWRNLTTWQIFMWTNSPHSRSSCGQILDMTEQIVMWKKLSTWEMWRRFVMRRNDVSNLWCFVTFYAVLLQNLSFMQFTLFCREICYVAIYALWRGEKLGQKFCLWRKKDKYQVCPQLTVLYTRTLGRATTTI